MRILEKISIQNFKSIRSQELALGRLNVFIGGNGAGKSNLVQAFRFLREVVQQNLAHYSLERGADSLLYFGRKTSNFMEFFHCRPTSERATKLSRGFWRESSG